nr:NAD-dependent epimerase/dehydratase family protein [bacterium]
MTEQALLEMMTQPSPQLVDFFKTLKGDIMVLGAGGKMGPSLCILAARAAKEAGSNTRIIAVSRFSDSKLPQQLNAYGVETLSADLMDDAALAALPDVDNIIYMVGRKFGTTGAEHLTWAMNVYLPGRVAQRFPKSRFVVFSSGNIYPFMPITQGGAREDTPLSPVGEYATTCLGRERIFTYFSQQNNTPMAIYRLNYAIDLRYGVLYDIASAIWEGRSVSVNMGCFNCIWQGDANEWALRLLEHCEVPAKPYNITGPEIISIRQTALEFGRLLGRDVKLTGEESTQALLNNASATHKMFGYPRVGVAQMMEMVADWVKGGGVSLGKPTHFETTDGKY